MTTEPKKGVSLNSLALIKPATSVLIGTKTIYLYPLRVDDTVEISRLSADQDASTRFRSLLPHIASLIEHTNFKEKRESLPAELVEQLSDAELEKLADAYAAIPSFMDVRTGKGDNAAAVTRQAGESAVSYLDRLLIAALEEDRRIFEKIRLNATDPISKLLERVKLSSLNLGESLSAFDKFSPKSTTPSITFDAGPTEKLMAASRARDTKLASERKEALEINRITGEMTSRSAKLLQDLSQAASDFLQRFDERSEKADKATRRQLRIAVFSVAISALLAAIALAIAIASYFQDSNNNSINRQLQMDVLDLQKTKSGEVVKIEREVEDLRSQLREIQEQSKGNPSTIGTGRKAVVAPNWNLSKGK